MKHVSVVLGLTLTIMASHLMVTPTAAAQTTDQQHLTVEQGFFPIGAHLSAQIADLARPNILRSTIAGGVSDDGLVVAGGSGEPGDRAFVTSYGEAAELKWIPDLPITSGVQIDRSIQSWAEGLSRDGTYVVGSSLYRDERLQAFRWSATHGTQGLGFLESGTFSSAAAVSDDGSIVIGEADTTNAGDLVTMPFVWTEESGMTILGALNATNPVGSAYALSSDGTIIGGSSDGKAFIWRSETGMTELGRLSDQKRVEDVACAMSWDGQIIAGGAVSDRSQPKLEAFIFSDGTMQALGDFPGGEFYSIVYSLSADGKIAVGEGTTERGLEAFLWDEENGMRLLESGLREEGMNLDGWVLRRAVAISADGRTIVGAGERNGIRQGWIAKRRL